MSDFGVSLSGSERKVILRFAEFPSFAHDRLLIALTNIEQRLEAAVLAAAPQGATSTLSRLIGGRVYDHGTRIAAVVGVRVKDAADPRAAARKAAALEYGSRGTPIRVRAHSMSLDHFWNRAVSKRSEIVKGYSRTPKIAAVRFLRDPAQALRESAIAEMRAAVASAAQDTVA